MVVTSIIYFDLYVAISDAGAVAVSTFRGGLFQVSRLRFALSFSPLLRDIFSTSLMMHWHFRLQIDFISSAFHICVISMRLKRACADIDFRNGTKHFRKYFRKIRPQKTFSKHWLLTEDIDACLLKMLSMITDENTITTLRILIIVLWFLSGDITTLISMLISLASDEVAEVTPRRHCGSSMTCHESQTFLPSMHYYFDSFRHADYITTFRWQTFYFDISADIFISFIFRYAHFRWAVALRWRRWSFRHFTLRCHHHFFADDAAIFFSM